MESYYDLLEVSRRASPEVIEKAYKVLVKKYHPDVQADADKQASDEKMKKLNEAYEVLIDPNKRAEYDVKLENDLRKEEQQQNRWENINNTAESEIEQETVAKQPINNITEKLRKKIEFEQQVNNAYENAYNDAYYKYLKDLGYKVITKKTFKEWIKELGRKILAIALTILILWLIWLIPPVNNMAKSMYNENSVIQFFIDFITGVFNTIFGGK